MPASISTSLLVFGAVLTAISAPAGVAVAGLGLLWEAWLFFLSGRA